MVKISGKHGGRGFCSTSYDNETDMVTLRYAGSTRRIRGEALDLIGPSFEEALADLTKHFMAEIDALQIGVAAKVSA